MSTGNWCGDWIRLGGGVWGAGILGPQVPWPLRRVETRGEVQDHQLPKGRRRRGLES